MKPTKANFVLSSQHAQQVVQLTPSAKIYLNSFRPICYTGFGVNAITKYGISPFVDASCRREPDFENFAPSISAICRKGKFAPRLKVDDIVIYMTVGGSKRPYKQGHHLVAILQVEEIYQNHNDAYRDYVAMGLSVPGNCIVNNNPPCAFDETAGDFVNAERRRQFLSATGIRQQQIGAGIIRVWDHHYQGRVNQHSDFIRTKSLYKELQAPPIISIQTFKNIFGRIPGTRNPPAIGKNEANQLVQSVGINITFI